MGLLSECGKGRLHTVGISESLEMRTPYFSAVREKSSCIKSCVQGKKEKMATYNSRQFPPRDSTVLVLQNHFLYMAKKSQASSAYNKSTEAGNTWCFVFCQ